MMRGDVGGRANADRPSRRGAPGPAADRAKPRKRPSAQYMVIAEALAGRINGVGPNTLLPTENDLAAEFGVSRVTVRQALRVLEQTGAISRRRGRGTIVSPPKIVRNAYPFSTVEEDFRRQGIAYETRILDFQQSCAPPEAIRAALRLPAHAVVGKVHLVRVVKGSVICFERRYWIASLVARLSREKILGQDILRLALELLSIEDEVGEFNTEITPAGEEAARALEITPGTLMLENSFVHSGDGRRPFEAGSICYRVDRCKFRAVGRLPARALARTEAGEGPVSAVRGGAGRAARLRMHR